MQLVKLDFQNAPNPSFFMIQLAQSTIPLNGLSSVPLLIISSWFWTTILILSIYAKHHLLLSFTQILFKWIKIIIIIHIINNEILSKPIPKKEKNQAEIILHSPIGADAVFDVTAATPERMKSSTKLSLISFFFFLPSAGLAGAAAGAAGAAGAAVSE